jgi:hypothetical protein
MMMPIFSEVASFSRTFSSMSALINANGMRLLQYDEFARYCIKMATGSGKTKEISLAVAWQFFNAVVEARDDYVREQRRVTYGD